MKLFKSLFATVAALMIATSAHAAGTATVQAYAHPTMFGTQVQSTQAEGVYLVGDKVLKSDSDLSVQGKENVVIDSMAKNLMSKLEKLIGKQRFKELLGSVNSILKNRFYVLKWHTLWLKV